MKKLRTLLLKTSLLVFINSCSSIQTEIDLKESDHHLGTLLVSGGETITLIERDSSGLIVLKESKNYNSKGLLIDHVYKDADDATLMHFNYSYNGNILLQSIFSDAYEKITKKFNNSKLISLEYFNIMQQEQKILHSYAYNKDGLLESVQYKDKALGQANENYIYNNQRLLIKKTYKDFDLSESLINYTYNPQNKLIFEERFKDGSFLESTTYSYNAQNLVSNIIRKGIKDVEEKFTYNENGLLLEHLYIETQEKENYIEKKIYEYAPNGKISRQFYFINDLDLYKEVYSYSYEEDHIIYEEIKNAQDQGYAINRSYKNGILIEEIKKFLPSKEVFSKETRALNNKNALETLELYNIYDDSTYKVSYIYELDSKENIIGYKVYADKDILVKSISIERSKS